MELAQSWIPGFRCEHVREIAGSQPVDALVDIYKLLEDDAAGNWQPVEGLQHLGDVIPRRCPCHKPGSIIVDELELPQQIVRNIRQEGIAIVQVGRNQGDHEAVTDRLADEAPDRCNPPQMKVALLACVLDMVAHAQVSVKMAAQVANRRHWLDDSTTHYYSLGETEFLQVV